MNYAATSGLANPLGLAADNRRFTALDWWEEDPDSDRCYSHVLLYRGFDLSAAGIWTHEFAPCLFCRPAPAHIELCLILDDELLNSGRRVHFVCCGNCGTRGPWAETESGALALWRAAHRRHT